MKPGTALLSLLAITFCGSFVVGTVALFAGNAELIAATLLVGGAAGLLFLAVGFALLMNDVVRNQPVHHGNARWVLVERTPPWIPGRAGTIQDRNGRHIGSIDEAGRIVDNYGPGIGRINDSGEVFDENGRQAGNVWRY